MEISIMQGDAVELPFVVKMDGKLVTPDVAETVEITIGTLTRRYPGEVTYDEKKQQWLCPLTQEQTFGFPAGSMTTQVRVRLPSGSVRGAPGRTVRVTESLSKGVI